MVWRNFTWVGVPRQRSWCSRVGQWSRTITREGSSSLHMISPPWHPASLLDWMASL